MPLVRHIVSFFRRRGTLPAILLALIAVVPPLTGFSAGKPRIVRPAHFASRPEAAEWPTTGRVDVLLELDEPATAQTYARDIALSKADRAAERRATEEARARLARVRREQTDLLARLRQPRLETTVLFDVQRIVNGIAVTTTAENLGEIRRMPGVKAVHRLQTHYLANAASVPLIGAPAVWARGTGATGKGVKIGIIDTGIDYRHTAFGGTPGATFPTAKVVGGYDFAGDRYDGGTPAPDADPMDCNGHGTHVAGTAAGFGVNADGTTYRGPYSPETPFRSLKIGPGVAPEASLYALKVFGCKDGTTLTIKAIEWAVDPNGDGDFSDHLDIVNLSLGTPFGAPDTIEAKACDAASLAGVVCVAAAGNNGDTHYITSSPASAPRAISVAGTIDDGQLTAAIRVTAPAEVAGDYPFVFAGFGPRLPNLPGLTGEVVRAVAGQGCDTFVNAAQLRGKIALIERDGCPLVTRALRAQEAGAVAVIFANDAAGTPQREPLPTPLPTISIPTVLLSKKYADPLKAAATPATVTLAGGIQAVQPELADTLYPFSARGPAVGNGIKPDIAAPAVAIISAEAGSGDDATGLSGTSMATPHVAGAAALVRQLHPDWTVEEIKAALINTANADVFTGAERIPPRYDPARVGVGRINANLAADPANTVLAYTTDRPGQVNVSFGVIEAAEVTTQVQTVRVANKGTRAAEYRLQYQPLAAVPGADIDFPDGETLVVAAGETKTFRVRLTVDPTKLKHTRTTTVRPYQLDEPRHWLTEVSGRITLTATTDLPSLRLALHAAPRPASRLKAKPTDVVFAEETGTIRIEFDGTDVNGTAAPTSPEDEISLAMPFELQEISPDDPESTGSADAADLRYVGIASDSPDNTVAGTTVYFAVATHGDWSTPHQSPVFIFIDTNRDGTDDFRILSSDVRLPKNGFDPTDVFAPILVPLTDRRFIFRHYTNALPASILNTNPFNTNILVFPVALADLGITEANRGFNYRIETFATGVGMVDRSQTHFYDPTRPAIAFSGRRVHPDYPVLRDVAGGTIEARYRRNEVEAFLIRGILVLHFHNERGARAEVLTAIGLPEPTSIQIDRVSFDGATLRVTGRNFAFAGVTVTVNDRNVSEFIRAQTPTQVLVEGSAARLNLRPGPNRITVSAGGMTSKPYTLNYFVEGKTRD